MIVFHQQIFLGEEKNKMAARDAIGSRTSLAVSRGITRCIGSFYYAENKLQILVLFTSLVRLTCWTTGKGLPYLQQVGAGISSVSALPFAFAVIFYTSFSSYPSFPFL